MSHIAVSRGVTNVDPPVTNRGQTFEWPLPRWGRALLGLWLLGLWLLGLGSVASAAGPFVLSQNMEAERLWPAMEILEAPVAREALLANPDEYAFRPVREGESHLDMGEGFWVRFSVRNPGDEAISWRLHHKNGLAGRVEPVVIVDGAVVLDALRALPHRTPLFEIITPAGAEQHIYVWRTTHTRLVFRAEQWRAWSAPALQDYMVSDAAMKGATYGIMMALVIYNLFLFLSLRIPAYGFYVLFAGFFMLTWMSWSGLLLRAFSLTSWPAVMEPVFLAMLGGLAVVEFARRLLETATRAPDLDTFLRRVRVLLIAGALIALIPHWGMYIATFFTLLVASIPVVAAIAWYRGFQPARFLLLGTALFTLGGVALVILQLSGISVTGKPLQWVPMLQVLELLLMSFALADRTRALQRENILMEQAHIATLTRAQQELEDKVQARTAELEAAKGQAELLARTDALTGVANRRAVLEAGKAELLRARRYERPLSVIMLDIDHFKRINDTYGHASGDHVLTELSSQMVNHLRETDCVGRLGGEEFVVLLPEVGLADACRFAERLRAVVETARFALPDTDLQVTASFGVATLSDADADLETLLHRADLALYQAKDAGRNRVLAQDYADTREQGLEGAPCNEQDCS